MQLATLRKSGFILLGTVITVVQMVRAPESVAITLVVGGTTWWVMRRRHASRPTNHIRRARQFRRRVVSVGIMTAAMWMLFMVGQSGYELTDMLTQPDGGDSFEGFPGRSLLEGLLSTTGITYLVLAVAEQPRRHRRRRRDRSKQGQLAAAQAQPADEA